MNATVAVPRSVTGALEIRRADRADEPQLRRQLAKYKIARNADERFGWIYRRNPQGQAETWLAISRATDEIVGFTSVHARTFEIDGERLVGGVGFDAFVRPDHRRMGIMTLLHKASLRDMADGAVPFRFMCGPPAPANLGALLKVGACVVGQLRMHVRPLTLSGALAMSHYTGTGSRLLAGAAARLDRLVRPAGGLVGRTLAVGIRASRCTSVGQAFDQLWNEQRRRWGITGVRDAAFLRWRYLENPVCEQELIALELGERLVGYAVLEFGERGALVVDHVLPPSRIDALRAIEALAAFATARGADRLLLRLSLGSSEKWLWRSAGFLPGRMQEELQVLAPEARLRERLASTRDWHFTTGDLNPEATNWSVVASVEAPFSDSNYREQPSNGT